MFAQLRLAVSDQSSVAGIQKVPNGVPVFRCARHSRALPCEDSRRRTFVLWEEEPSKAFGRSSLAFLRSFSGREVTVLDKGVDKRHLTCRLLAGKADHHRLAFRLSSTQPVLLPTSASAVDVRQHLFENLANSGRNVFLGRQAAVDLSRSAHCFSSVSQYYDSGAATTAPVGRDLFMQCRHGAPHEYRVQRMTTSHDKPNGDEEERAKRSYRKAGPAELSAVLQQLREELPFFFEGGHVFSTYSSDVRFVNSFFGKQYTSKGVRSYRFQAEIFRWYWLFLNTDLRVQLITCKKEAQESSVVIRWQIVGRPRLIPKSLATPDRLSYLNGISAFEVNGNGEIHRHVLNKVTIDKRPQPIVTSALALIAAVGALTSQAKENEAL